MIRLRGDPKGDRTRKNRRRCEVPLGFGTAKAVITSRAAMVHVPTLLTPSQELAARGITKIAAFSFFLRLAPLT